MYNLKFVRKTHARVKNKQKLWHGRFGHLNEQNMPKLVREQLANYFDYDITGEVGVCEACIGGKQCKSSFKSSETVTSMPLESIGRAKYFLTLLDDKTHYTWVFPQGPVFKRFKKWQAEVENFTGRKVKTLRTRPVHLKVLRSTPQDLWN